MIRKGLFTLFVIGLMNVTNAQNIYFTTDTTKPPELEIGEVVIAASKDNSQLKKLPTSVSIISSSLIESNQIVSLNDVSGIAANFFMPDYGSKLTSPVYIRGIGSRINAPSVGLYVDNVPYFEKAAFDFDFFDVEKLEILRGPQGTLYGRNSMGGLINVITKSPMNYQGSFVNISAGNYGNYKFNASHYMKMSESVALSLSANYHHNNGFYTNVFLDKQVDKSDSFGLRSRLIYQHSKKLTLENIANFEQLKQGGYPYAVFNDSLNKSDAINYNQESSYGRIMFSDGLNIRYSATNWELTNTLSYQLLDDEQKIDQDFTVDSMYFIQQLMVQHMVSNELILRSKGDKRYSWLIGAFGFMQFFDRSVEVDVYKTKVWYIKHYEQEVSSFAIFHQSTFRITNNLTLIGGLRYDAESSKLHYRYQMKRAGAQLANEDTIYQELNDHILLPKIALNYTFKNASIYASFTTGYKPGGFNSTFELPEHLLFKNENSLNYEAGLKTSLFQKVLYADFALFFTKLQNQQIYRTVPSGRGSYLANAGLSENKGVELTLKSKSFAGFEALMAYGYTHSQILEYVEDSITNYNNNYTPYIPRHNFAAQLTQTINLQNTAMIDKLILNISYNQQGALYWNLDNVYKEASYAILNAKASFIKNDFQFDFWAKNIMNSQYHSFLFEALGNTYVQNGKPFHFGVNISAKF